MSFVRDDDSGFDGEFANEPLPALRLTRLPDELWVRRLTPLASADLALEIIDQTAALVQRARELRSLAEDLAVAWLERNGELTCGDVRYFAGHRSVTRCTDPVRAVELLLEATAGDLQNFASLLGASAFRYGGCRLVLTPDRFSEVFATEKKVELREGKPHKRLLRSDDRFAGPRRQGGGR